MRRKCKYFVNIGVDGSMRLDHIPSPAGKGDHAKAWWMRRRPPLSHWLRQQGTTLYLVAISCAALQPFLLIRHLKVTPSPLGKVFTCEPLSYPSTGIGIEAACTGGQSGTPVPTWLEKHRRIPETASTPITANRADCARSAGFRGNSSPDRSPRGCDSSDGTAYRHTCGGCVRHTLLPHRQVRRR